MTLDGMYTGYPKTYEFNWASGHLYDGSGLLTVLPLSAKLNEHYTHPSLMGWYNLVSTMVELSLKKGKAS